MARDSFVFYKSWAEMMAKMPDKELAALTRALTCYQIGVEYTIDDPMVEAVFTMMKGQLDKDAEKYEEVCRIHRESGKKGGRPPKEDETKRLSEEPNETKRFYKKPSADEYDNDMNINMIIKEKDTPKGVSKEKKHKHGDKVLLTDTEYEKLKAEYGTLETEEAIRFLDDYIKEKAYKSKEHYLALRRWVFDAVAEQKQKRKRLTEKPRSGTNKFNTFEQRQNDMSELEARMFNRRVGT